MPSRSVRLAAQHTHTHTVRLFVTPRAVVSDGRAARMQGPKGFTKRAGCEMAQKPQQPPGAGAWTLHGINATLSCSQVFFSCY